MGMNYEGEPGVYTYSRTSLGKSASGIVANGAQSGRNPAAQKSAGGQDRQEGDHGGHLIAHSLGGRNDGSNLDAQAANVNQSDQAHVERNVSALARNPENTVAIEVSNYNSHGDRPDATMIHTGVQNQAAGVTDERYSSFQNASHDQQEAWNDSAARVDSGIDPAQDMGMTSGQRAEANELCGAENGIDDSLGSGWSYTGFDSSFLDGGAVDGAASGEDLGGSFQEASSEDGAGELSGGETAVAGNDEGMGL